MFQQQPEPRRGFLRAAASAAFGVPASTRLGEAQEKPAGGEHEEEVSPAEDLMREHGVLDRVLLVYEEAAGRLGSTADLDPAVLRGAAGVIRRFIEEYHEKLEEQHLFPRFEKAKVQLELVAVLHAQHLAGRKVTERIETLATAASVKAPAERRQLAEALRASVRMYRPHAAREDTVLFPALRRIVSAHEYGALGEQFEDEEHERFGEDGFEKVVDEVAGLERRLGIQDLARFTPA